MCSKPETWLTGPVPPEATVKVAEVKMTELYASKSAAESSCDTSIGVAWRWVWKLPKPAPRPAFLTPPAALRSIQNTVFGSCDSSRNFRWVAISAARLRSPGASSTSFSALKFTLQARQRIQRSRVGISAILQEFGPLLKGHTP